MSARQIAIIDSGGANIASLVYACDRLGHQATLTTDPERIRRARRVILPGVGAARDAMQRLRDNKLIDVIRRLEQPVLGICLGMQLLAEASEEEDVECLGIVPGTVQKLSGDTHCPVPNMGWCPIEAIAEHDILPQAEEDAWFYFLHSYALPVSACTIATAKHTESFSAMIAHGNFIAAQFHPERSSLAGAKLLRNFLGGDA
jgi:glutamine amidotransferase